MKTENIVTLLVDGTLALKFNPNVVGIKNLAPKRYKFLAGDLWNVFPQIPTTKHTLRIKISH